MTVKKCVAFTHTFSSRKVQLQRSEDKRTPTGQHLVMFNSD